MKDKRSGKGSLDVVVVGGCGRVGLPLALAFAHRGLRCCSYDIDERAVKEVGSGQLPFLEPGADDILRAALAEGSYSASTDPAVVSQAQAVVVVIGTPVDEHLNPNPHAVPDALEDCVDHLRDGQLVVLRSTIYPGVTRRVERLLESRGLRLDVAFCPERIAEGRAMEELFLLPQIVAGRSPETRERAADLFRHLTPSIIELEPEEAELAKLFTNAWRYLKFAAANQFFVMANEHGLDFERIRAAIVEDYPRAADMPGAGFAAGPCLLKDTMQLAAFSDNAFVLGHSAMLVNEGLPLYLVSRLERRYELAEMVVGILGTAFKGGSDDIRSSLAYKLKRILQFRAKEVMTTDPYVTVDPGLQPLDVVLRSSDLLVIATPHREYRDLSITKPVVDVWNLLGRGTRRMSLRVSVVIPVYEEGDALVPVMDRVLDAVESDCEILIIVDSEEDSTMPVLAQYGLCHPQVRALVSTYGSGPANAIRYGIDRATSPVVVVTMADGSDDPRQIDSLARLVDRGVAVAAASRYMPGGQHVGGPLLKGLMSLAAGLSLHTLARVGTRDATNSFKAYSTDFVRQVGIHSRHGFEIGLELTAKARRLRLPIGEVPTIWLDRTTGVSNFDMRGALPNYVRWYRFAFGPRLSVEELRLSAGALVDGHIESPKGRER